MTRQTASFSSTSTSPVLTKRIKNDLPLFLAFYRVILFPLAMPTALLLDWWLGPEGVAYLKEQEIRLLIARHGASGGDIGKLEAIGAQNFLDLDDVSVCDEG